MLKREDVQKMAYQSYLGIDYTDKKKDELLKKYNRKIIRNYIICMMIQLLGMVKNPETRAPSIITKWVETKDFRV